MATIIWRDSKGKSMSTHTLDPQRVVGEIRSMGGTVINIKQPQEVQSRLERDPDTGKLKKVRPVYKPEEEPEPTPDAEEEEPSSPSMKPISKRLVVPERYPDVGEPQLRPAPPIREPSVFDRPDTTATPEQLRKLSPPREGIVPVGLPPSETIVREEQDVKIRRAEREAGERIEVERTGFEERERPIAGDVTQKKYNEIMGSKATELGMTFDVGSGAWVGDQSQIERFREYEPEARVEAMSFGNDYYQRQWEQFGLSDRAGEITSEEFAEEGFKIVEKPDGTFTVLTEAEFKRQQRVSREKERIRERITGTPEERVAQLALFVSSAFIKPFSETGLLGVTGEALFGGEDKGEVILGKLARESVEFEGKTPQELFAKSFTDPEGFGFTAALALVTTGAGGLLGKIGGPGGKIIQKGVPVVIRGALVTTIGAEIGITAAMEGKEEAGKLAFRRFGQIAAFETFGALATGRPILPKVQREIVLEAKTGVLTEQRFFDVFGKKLLIPGIKHAQILTPTVSDTVRVLGIPSAKPFGTGPTFKEIVPSGLAQTSFTGKVPIIPSVGGVTLTVSKFGDLTFVDTGVFKPTVGIPEPGIYTGRQPVLRGIRSIVEQQKPGKLVIFEPELKFAAITESMEKNLTFIAKDSEWKIGKGIKSPVPVREFEKSLSERQIFPRKQLKIKPSKKVVTRFDVTPEGIVSLEKYGVKSLEVGKVKETGLPIGKIIGQMTFKKLYRGISDKPTDYGIVGKGEYYSGFKEIAEYYGKVITKKITIDRALILTGNERILLQEKLFGKSLTGQEKDLSKRFDYYLREKGIKGVAIYEEDISTTLPTEVVKLSERMLTFRGPRPLVEVKRKPGIIIPIEETFPLIKRLESGLAPGFEGLVTIKPIVAKKGKQFLFKDIVKIEDTTLKTISGDRQKTIQILKEPITKQELKLKSLTKTKKKDVVVSKLKAKSIMVTEKQYLESMTQMKQVVPIQKQELRLGLILSQDIRSKQLKKTESGILLDMAKTESTIQRNVSRFGLIPLTTTDQIQDTSFKFRTTLLTSFISPIVEPPVIKPPVVKPPYKPFEEIIEPPVKIPTLPFEEDLMKGVSLIPQSYDVYTYKTQFKDGRRIRGKVLEKINKKPLRRLDALALGSDVVDNNAKRSIILKPAEGKPHRPRKKLPSWSSQMFEYNDKGNDVFVETNRHAIDSPGEIREITMKGIAARKRGSKRSNSGIPRSISSLESRLSRRLII